MDSLFFFILFAHLIVALTIVLGTHVRNFSNSLEFRSLNRTFDLWSKLLMFGFYQINFTFWFNLLSLGIKCELFLLSLNRKFVKSLTYS